MAISSKAGFLILFSLLFGGLGGGYAGFRLGSDWAFNNWVTADANRIESVVRVLRTFRQETPLAGIEKLEAHLDSQLEAFNSIDELDLKNNTLQRAQESIQTADAYRAEYPRQPLSHR